ncbi:MAG: DNA-protecting protein DprA [Oligoflexia bacterium]|nr:DNA-protecting protein DprA [Oligoflexia bacterium]
MFSIILHRFFELSLSRFEHLLSIYTDEKNILKKAFANEISLPRRQLSHDFPKCFKQALEFHKKFSEQEEKNKIQKVSLTKDSPFSFLFEFIPRERLPLIIYYKGNALFESNKSISVVGTRHPSSLGREACKTFSSYFSAMNFQVISGLAIGIDSIAHNSSLIGGSYAWVAGCLLETYPKENTDLAEKIINSKGGIFSPFPTYQIPIARNFPTRNEFIAASSIGTMMVEGGVKSGASITAKWALLMGKNVVTLSQDYRTEYGRGATEIQRSGANFVSNEKEALEHLLYGCK